MFSFIKLIVSRKMELIRLFALVCLIGSVTARQCLWDTYNTSVSRLLIECDADVIDIDFLGGETTKTNSTLVELQIHAGLVCIANYTFTGAGNLQSLNLSQNEVQIIEANAFLGLHQLEQLDLSDNKLTGLHVTTFDGLIQLKKLDLQNNRLSSFDFKCLTMNAWLSDLELEGNVDIEFVVSNGQRQKRKVYLKPPIYKAQPSMPLLKSQLSNTARFGPPPFNMRPINSFQKLPSNPLKTARLPARSYNTQLYPPKDYRVVPQRWPKTSDNIAQLLAGIPKNKVATPTHKSYVKNDLLENFHRWQLERQQRLNSELIETNVESFSQSELYDPSDFNSIGETGLSSVWILTIVLVLTLGVPCLLFVLLVYFC